jgi:hypothetical protein
MLVCSSIVQLACAHQMLLHPLRLLLGCKEALCGGVQGVRLSLYAGLVLLLHGVAKYWTNYPNVHSDQIVMWA